ncbi:AraC family transcriptional regulator [Motiliproteus coralliicola]|uniref:AraC family transcriptional regulator n=1 Tax=Motiliproteus coralliicola TaxID=2283196 RepID=A0A369WRW9_9GAMM|nr:AraC family transcriptional regulator [Motiliproteus coralliicola]RDE24860.1 AraC family transcriptional regulator [Motiliproteus coralliicola]
MSARLSIRSYSFHSDKHQHDYHQLVLPMAGSIDIETLGQRGRAAPGSCVIIPAGQPHWFAPDPEASFLVADLTLLPANLLCSDQAIIRISPPMQAFCTFVQQQLEHQVSPELEQQLGDWFIRLLSEQNFLYSHDSRITRVLNHLEQDLSQSPSLAELADIACLSLSQLKTLFKKQTGRTVGQQLLRLRMEKARALLLHTDYPIGIIAQQVGYQDFSTFSHRFSCHYGHPPSQLRLG